MGAVSATQTGLLSKVEPPGVILTFVAPSSEGCDLSCPFCYIRQRREDATSAHLTPNDYVDFIARVAEQQRMGAICIQGDEPLLDCLQYTRTMFEVGKRPNVPTSLVTNGTNLQTASIPVISYSADVADYHNQRDKINRFSDVIRGVIPAVDQKTASSKERRGIKPLSCH